MRQRSGRRFAPQGLDRGDVFLTTKCFNDDHGHEQARRAFHASLERLEMDYVDLYLIHWPVPAHDRYVETWKAFIELRDEGLDPRDRRVELPTRAPRAPDRGDR